MAYHEFNCQIIIGCCYLGRGRSKVAGIAAILYESDRDSSGGKADKCYLTQGKNIFKVMAMVNQNSK